MGVPRGDEVGPRTRGVPRKPQAQIDLGVGFLARIARGQTYHLTSGVTSPLQGAEQRILHVIPLKRGRDPGSQTICLPPGYSGKVRGTHLTATQIVPQQLGGLGDGVPRNP